MNIQHVFPSSAISLANGLQVQDYQPDAAVNKSPFGPHTAMRYSSGVLRKYSGTFEELDAGSVDIRRLNAFFDRVPPGFETSWILEAISGTHHKLRCPDLGDGTKKSFIIPMLTGGTITGVFVDGVPTTAYTDETISTLIDDDASCNGDGGSIGAPVTGSDPLTVSEADYAMGYTSILLTPAASTAVNISHDDMGVTVGDNYTANAHFLAEAGDYELRIKWRNATAPLSTDTATLTVAAGGWVDMTKTATAPTGALYARVQIARTTSSASLFYLGGWSFQRGDYTQIFLPSYSPGLINFTTAPADGAEIRISGTGQRMTKVWWPKASPWRQYELGRTAPGNFEAVEVRT